MALNVAMVTMDTLDPGRLATWWAEAFGAEAREVMADEFYIVALPSGLNLGFQRVEDPTPGKNRLHLDLGADDVQAEVDLLVSRGAVETGRHSFGDAFSWVVLTDPDGNAFCVAAGH